MTSPALNDSTRMIWTAKEPIPPTHRFIRYIDYPDGTWAAEIEKIDATLTAPADTSEAA